MTRRVLLGYRASQGDWGLWCAKAGKSIDSTTADDFQFQMNYRNARPYSKGTISSISRTYLSTGGFDINRAEYTSTIAHGLGYYPLHLVSANFRLPGGTGSFGVIASGQYYCQQVDISVDTSNLYVTFVVNKSPAAGQLPYVPPTTLTPTPVSYQIFRNQLA